MSPPTVILSLLLKIRDSMHAMGCKSPRRRTSICGNGLRDAGRTVLNKHGRIGFTEQKKTTLCSAGTVGVE